MIPVEKKFEQELLESGVLSEEQAEGIKNDCSKQLNEAYNNSKSHEFNIEEWTSPEWEAVRKIDGKARETGLNVEYLRDLGNTITTLPADWNFHP